MSKIFNNEKEEKIILNTGEGQVSFKTDKFTGKLDGIIIDSPEKISIIIESELGYLILKRADLFGINYLSIRNHTTTPEERVLDYPDFDEFLLNESLIITVMGNKNKDVQLIFRFS